MNIFNDNINYFEYKGKLIRYYLKDIDIKSREKYGEEMATAYITVFEKDNSDEYVVFQIYDKKTNILHALPVDAKRWYIDYLRESGENNEFC
ncbi:MAG: hypothetical protein IJB51_09890 [Clostridia bacterium]|nr:hypothetical protein [Clostridia bacterium]